MSRCDGIVVEASGTDVLVEVSARVSACGSCTSQDACQNSLLGLSSGPRRYRLENRVGARVGDRVSLDVADGTLWRAAAASYVVPVLLALGGAVAGQGVGGDTTAIAGCVAGLVAGLALLRLKETRARRGAGPFSLLVEGKGATVTNPACNATGIPVSWRSPPGDG